MRETISRLDKFTLVRLVFLICAVIIAVYLTVMVANMGGELDRIRKAEIREAVAIQVYLNPVYRQLPPEQLEALVNGLVQDEIKRLGMDQPFFPQRGFQYLWRAMTLELGWAEQMTSEIGRAHV